MVQGEAPKNCAIAKAIREIFPNGEAHADFIRVGRVDMRLPVKAQKFITLFDNYHPADRAQMKPFSFSINVPKKLVTSIGISEVYRILSESKTLELAENFESV